MCWFAVGLSFVCLVVWGVLVSDWCLRGWFVIDVIDVICLMVAFVAVWCRSCCGWFVAWFCFGGMCKVVAGIAAFARFTNCGVMLNEL